MSHLTPPNWEHIRDVWESDPTLSYGELAKKFMVSKNTIYARSKRENWQRTGNVVDLAKEATRRVNAKANESNEANEAESVKGGQEEAIDRRVAATEKHVEQLAKLDAMQDKAAILFDDAMLAKITAKNSGDDQLIKTAKALWWQAKIAADCVKDHCMATKIKQAMTRIALEMDTAMLSEAEMSIITEDEMDSMIAGKIPARFIRRIG